MERTLQRSHEIKEAKSSYYSLSDIVFILSGPALLSVIIYLFLELL